MKTHRVQKQTSKLSFNRLKLNSELLRYHSKELDKTPGKVLNLAVTSSLFQAAFLRKEHFQASLRFKTSQSVEQEICKQKIVNFKRKLNGTENIYFSFGD